MDNFVYSDDQQAAIEKIIATKAKAVVLKGHAGTGKTAVMKQLLNHFDDIVLTAPTHKAASVLAKETGHGANTIHSALGLVLSRNKDTLEMELVQKEHLLRVFSRDVLVVDEASMVDDKLYNLIARTECAKIIFIGDPGQLPPVKSYDSPVFRAGLETYELTTNHRQGSGNPILDVANDIRMGTIDFKRWATLPNIHVVKSGGADTLKEFFIEAGNRAAIAYTNDAVNAANNLARSAIYGPGRKVFEQDDIIFLRTPVEPPHGPKNNEVVRITSDPEAFEFLGYSSWCFQINDQYQINVPADGDVEAAINKAKAKLKKKFYDGGDKKARGEFVLLDESFTCVSYGYAFTTHKSQGSTFDHIIISISDMERMPEPREIKNRLLYTAVTRARESVTFIV